MDSAHPSTENREEMRSMIALFEGSMERSVLQSDNELIVLKMINRDEKCDEIASDETSTKKNDTK
jgi:hypothetical protein